MKKKVYWVRVPTTRRVHAMKELDSFDALCGMTVLRGDFHLERRPTNGPFCMHCLRILKAKP